MSFSSAKYWTKIDAKRVRVRVRESIKGWYMVIIPCRVSVHKVQNIKAKSENKIICDDFNDHMFTVNMVRQSMSLSRHIYFFFYSLPFHLATFTTLHQMSIIYIFIYYVRYDRMPTYAFRTLQCIVCVYITDQCCSKWMIWEKNRGNTHSLTDPKREIQFLSNHIRPQYETDKLRPVCTP